MNDGTSGMSGGSLAANYGYVGYSGSGTFTQSGGTNSVGSYGGQLYLGYNAGDAGTYNLSGSASLTSFGGEYVGYSGSRHVYPVRWGKQHAPARFTSELGLERQLHPQRLGHALGLRGVRGRLPRTFTQSGGTNATSARSATTRTFRGSYNLSGSGVLSASAEYVGNSGAGTLPKPAGRTASAAADFT